MFVGMQFSRVGTIGRPIVGEVFAIDGDTVTYGMPDHPVHGPRFYARNTTTIDEFMTHLASGSITILDDAFTV